MSELSEIDEIRDQRDIAKARVVQLERELARAKFLLEYAEKAAYAEYQRAAEALNRLAQRT